MPSKHDRAAALSSHHHLKNLVHSFANLLRLVLPSGRLTTISLSRFRAVASTASSVFASAQYPAARLEMSTIDSRREQMFPKLTPQEIDRLRRFGEVRHYAAGEALFATGDVAPGMYVLIKGSVRVTRRDPLGHSAPIVEQEPGEFVAEVGQLSGQPAFVDVHAMDNVAALLVPPENLRALMIEEPELGGRIMNALILRRVALIEAGAGGPILIGPEFSPDVVRLARLPGPQCLPASTAGSCAGSGRGEAGPALCLTSRRPAAGSVPEGYDSEKPERSRTSAGTWNGADR
jgi:CRP-like cAMP-binding protein